MQRTLTYFFRFGLFLPFFWWVYQIFGGLLGVDPAKDLNHSAGEFALYLLLLNAALGLAIVFRLKIPRQIKFLLAQRRWIGVVSFFYLLVHLFFYMALEAFEFQAIEQMYTKTYLIFGSLALFLMFILALTSNDLSVRKLKFKNWKRLHQLVYLGFLFLSVHILLIEKTDLIKYGILLGLFWILQGIRFTIQLRKRKLS